MKMFVKHQLVGNAHLMVGVFESQLVEGLLIGVYSWEVEVDGVENLIIGYTSLYDIIYRAVLSFTAYGDIVKPSVSYASKIIRENSCKFSSSNS